MRIGIYQKLFITNKGEKNEKIFNNRWSWILGSILKEYLVNNGDFVVSIDLEEDDFKNGNFKAIKEN